MQKIQENIITNRDIDAMSEAELVQLVRTHSAFLGNRFLIEPVLPPAVLDEAYFLRRLCRANLDRFAQMTNETFSHNNSNTIKWAAVLLSQGGNVPQELICKLEAFMAKSFTHYQKYLVFPENQSIHEADLDPVESALLLEVSQPIRQFWTERSPQYQFRLSKIAHLSQILKLRKEWLNMAHTQSASLLYTLGWKPLDVMLTYLETTVSGYISELDPDCVAAAVQVDPEGAAWLLDPDHYRAYFQDELHWSYHLPMAKQWVSFLYCYCDWKDYEPLRRGHRLKKMATHYQLVLEQCHQPDWEQTALETELRMVGLLVSEDVLDWENAKLVKAQRLTLTHTYVCHYQWRLSALRDAISASPKPEVFTSLLWGIYREQQLVRAFLLDRNGTALDETGNTIQLPEDERIGLVAPVELTKVQLSYWKKRLKAIAAKPYIRQLSISTQPPEFNSFQGVFTKHITIYSAVGKWGMSWGYDKSSHICAHLTDPLHQIGAQILFDCIWNGPEYSGDEVQIYGVTFYRMRKLHMGDCVPQNAVISPAELPDRFVSMVGAAFKQLAGLK